MTSPPNDSPPTEHPWLQVGDLEQLMQADGRLSLLRSTGLDVLRAECNYIRLKPGVGALLGLQLCIEIDGQPLDIAGYVRTHPGDRAAELASKWHGGRSVTTPAGAGVHLLAGGHSVLFLFPNDARVRGLRFLTDIDKLKRQLLELDNLAATGWRIRGRKTHITTVRYKPERRLILRAQLGLKHDVSGARASRDWFLRFFADQRGAEMARIRAVLAESPLQRYLPRLVGSGADGRLFVEERVEGVELLDEVAGGGGAADQVAHILTLLHATTVTGLPVLQTGEPLAVARESADNLRRVAPELSEVLEQILQRLQGRAPKACSPVTLHGDCHLHQFLQTADGPVLVDFERAVAGHPMFDLGHLLAHLRIHDLDQDEDHCAEFGAAVLADYCRQNPTAHHADFEFFLGCGLMERALLPFRRLQTDWRQRCAQLLKFTLANLPEHRITDPIQLPDGWERLHPRAKGDWPAVVGGKPGLYSPTSEAFTALVPSDDHKLVGVAEWCARGQLVAYRAGRRASFRVEALDRARYVKLVRPRRAAALVQRCQTAQRLSDELAPRLRIATLLEHDVDRGTLQFAALSGTSLHAILQADVSDRLDEVADGLAALHSIDATELTLPAAHQHGSLQTWCDFLRPYDPDLHRRARQLAEASGTQPRPQQGRPRLVHGDLHDRNILLGDAGEGLGLLDLDLLGRGDPTADLGNLCAHLILRGLQFDRPEDWGATQIRSLVAAYETRGGAVDRAALPRTIADTLLRLACLYRFRARWTHLSPRLLDAVSACGAGAVL